MKYLFIIVVFFFVGCTSYDRSQGDRPPVRFYAEIFVLSIILYIFATDLMEKIWHDGQERRAGRASTT